MQKVSLVDETFDLNFTSEYILSIQVSLDGFSFSILDTIQNKVVYLFHQDIFASEPEFQLKKLKAIYNEIDLLELPFKKIKLYFSAPDKTTLVPAPLFRNESAADLYRLNFDTDKHIEILNTYIPHLDAFAVFGIQNSCYSLLKEKHSGIDIHNDFRISAGKNDSGNHTLKIRILKKQLLVMALNSGSSTFCNCFHYEGENDILFYVLGAVKSMSTEPSAVIMDGIVNKHSAIYHLLRQYFENVQIAENNKEIHYSYLIDRLPDARFVNLFNSFTCE